MNSSTPGRSLLAMLLSFGLAIASTFLLSQAVFNEFILISFASLVAYAAAKLQKLSTVWLALSAALPGASALLILAPLPNWVVLLPAVALAIIFLPTVWTSVPFYPTNSAVYSKFSALLPSHSNFCLLELGSGFGTFAIFLAKKFPQSQIVGIEISTMPFIIGWLRAKIGRVNNLTLKCGSFWSEDLGKYDYVYAFLAPGPMPKLWTKVLAEMLPGSLFVSNTFAVPAAASQELAVPGPRQTVLYLHRL